MPLKGWRASQGGGAGRASQAEQATGAGTHITHDEQVCLIRSQNWRENLYRTALTENSFIYVEIAEYGRCVLKFAARQSKSTTRESGSKLGRVE